MKQAARVAFHILIVLFFSGCAADTTAEPSQTEGINPPSITEVPPTPASTVSLDERLLARIDVNQPDEIAFVQNFIWVKTDEGHLFQVDPNTNEIVADIDVDTTTDLYHFCQGLGTDGEYIWACSAAGDADNRRIDVVRIDPGSKSVVETIQVGKIFDQFDLPFLSNQIWVLVGDGSQLVGIDVTTNQSSAPILLGARCFQLAVMADSLMATCAQDNLLLQIDPEAGQVSSRIAIESPRNLVVTDDAIWVVQDNAILRLDPNSLEPIATFTGLTGVGTRGDISASEQAVWVRHESGFLYRIDPTNNQIIEQIEAGQPLSGGSVLVSSDSVWTTSSDDNFLFRLSLK